MNVYFHIDELHRDSVTANALSKRVLKMEYKLYLKVVELFCSNKIKIEKSKVIINE